MGLRSAAPKVALVLEPADWTLRWYGQYLTNSVNAVEPGVSGLVVDPARLFDRVVHLPSQHMWANWGQALSGSNRYAVTFFHGKPGDGPDVARHIDRFLALLPKADRIVTAASPVERRLIEWGVPRAKLVRIPIGVDTAKFTFAEEPVRTAAKAALRIPANRLCIGSFQKDGVGWGDGMEPKLIKGPDVFLEAVARIAKETPVYVLLTGPARGYVKAGLDRLGIPYQHRFLDDYLRIVECYHALDLYLMTSREEGGPMSIMESMATGVPVVATQCGMAEDILVDGANGALAAVGDAAGVSRRSLDLQSDPDRLQAMRVRARADVMAYDWSVVGKSHWELVYAPLLQGIQR